MRRLSRLDRSIARIRPKTNSSSLFLYSSCQIPTSPFSSTCRHEAPKSRALFDEDKMRQRIWGKDGQPDEEPLDEEGHISDAPKIVRKQKKTKTKYSYEPAETWDDLEEVGGTEIQYSTTLRKNGFQGYLTARNVTDPVELTASLRQALVEVFALRQAEMPLENLDRLVSPEASLTKEIGILPSDGQGADLVFSGSASLEDILLSLVGIEEKQTELSQLKTPSTTGLSAEEPQTAEQPTSREVSALAERGLEVWRQISLEDPNIKFAVIKRVMRLTGMFISDVKIKNTRTAGDLLNHMMAPVKPSKLVDALMQRGDLLQLPNVKIYNRRITPIDREKSVGRWKIIEKELEERGLPVTGRA